MAGSTRACSVIWRANEVCDRLGNCNRQAHLGGFEVAIHPDVDPPIPAEAEVQVDASDPDNVQARVHIQFHEHFDCHVVNWLFAAPMLEHFDSLIHIAVLLPVGIENR